MPISNIKLHLEDSNLKPENVVGICRKSNADVVTAVNKEISDAVERSIASLLASGTQEKLALAAKVSDPNSPEHAALREQVASEHLNTRMRELLTEAFGAEKASAIYEYMFNNLRTGERRRTLALSMYKLAQFEESRDFVKKDLTPEYLNSFLDLVDAANNTPDFNEEEEIIRQAQREGKYELDKSSVFDKLVSSILPNAKEGIPGVMRGALKFLKERMNIFGKKEEQTTDELCADLVTAPIGLFAMLCVSLVTGGAGFAMVTIPLHCVWKGISTVKGLTSEPEINVHDILSGVKPKIYTSTDFDFHPQAEGAEGAVATQVAQASTSKAAAYHASSGSPSQGRRF
ncbi:hypothetical protein O998_03405 [Anaplasma phagocytophilum str. Norway variant1]|uniref:Uncharacterized protein n=1 Tax=Anaplasma phagocytophilum str. Norway variant1 TaxID=1392506 RepID=A0A7H9E0I6_ANAPH|nr:hypothetical protein [Anaplasma phagocytophilum]QLL66826.1 hypothetical protein O998_03405 [Anaplasma phagocytophilum str. Norway variant1]